MKNESLARSFGNAVQGLRDTLSRERNFRIHIAMGILAVAACVVLRVEVYLFVWTLFAVFGVLAAELFNSSVEALTDLVCGEKKHPLAKIAKDAAAAAVLVTAVQAVAVAFVVAFTVIRGAVNG